MSLVYSPHPLPCPALSSLTPSYSIIPFYLFIQLFFSLPLLEIHLSLTNLLTFLVIANRMCISESLKLISPKERNYGVCVSSQWGSLCEILTCHESVLLMLKKHRKYYYVRIHSFLQLLTENSVPRNHLQDTWYKGSKHRLWNLKPIWYEFKLNSASV